MTFNWTEALMRATNYRNTENGGLGYKSTFNPNLDFFYHMGAVCLTNHEISSTVDEYSQYFHKAYRHNPLLATANLLYLRDPRKGLGSRTNFRYLVNQIEDQETLTILIDLIPEYGRWDDLLILIDHPHLSPDSYQKLVERVSTQLRKDLAHPESASLLAKWMPSENASKKETKELARKWRGALGFSPKNYRKTLSHLRKHIRIIENNLRTKDYTFDYSKVPGRAMNKYRQAFYRNDEERFQKYLKDIQEGRVESKVDMLYPHEIAHKLKHIRPSKLAEKQQEVEFYTTMWDSYKLPQDQRKTLVIRDGSGSMLWSQIYGGYTVLDVADALTLLFSQNLTGPFADSFITFSSRPEFVQMDPKESIYRKLKDLQYYDDCSNTNIQQVYALILSISEDITNPEDYIERLVIISDMEFDAMTNHTDQTPTFEYFKKIFKEKNIPFPEIAFWNVHSRQFQIPTSDIENVKLISGFSKKVMDQILKDTTPDAATYMYQTLEPYIKAIESVLSTK